MISTYSYNGANWVQLMRPGMEEVKQVLRKYGVDPLVASDLLSPLPKPKVSIRGNFIFLVLHFPAHRSSHSLGSKQEINFIIGKDFILTSQYDTVDALHRASKQMGVRSVLEKEGGVCVNCNGGSAAGSIFFYILEEIYQSVSDELSSIDDRLNDIESKIFDGREKHMVLTLSEISQVLLDFKKVLGFHKDILRSLEELGRHRFGDDFALQVSAIRDEYGRIRQTLDVHFESMKELRATNDGLLYTKQNEIMKVLTVLAFLILPAQTIVSLIQLPGSFTPIADMTLDFWLTIGLIIFVSLTLLILFRHKKWL